MNGQTVSQWTGRERTNLPNPGMWVRPELNPRTATSTSNPLLAMPLAALMAAAPLQDIGYDVQQARIVEARPISSGASAQLVSPRMQWVQVHTNDVVDENVTPTLIDQFRKKFGLSDNSLGEIFGVSRQTIYNWRTKKTVADNPDRVRALAESLAEISSRDISYIQRALFYPTADGRLIQDVLSDEGWVAGGEKAVRELILELAGKAQQLRERDEKTIARLEKTNAQDAGSNA